MNDKTISHYKILEELGRGGMGVVYKAEDTKLDRVVALKFLPPHLATSAQDKARFVQEAKAAAALNHPNICTIYGIDEYEKQLFIAMEFVDGQTVREKRGTISFKQAIEVGIQIADGLAAAHEKGIVHRDIKPENIMIRKDGIAQIMDFGLAKLRNASSQINRLTKEGSTVGTAGYMSPEQIQGQDADHRSDIFSYGVLLYELLTGQLPFKGVHETALAYEIVNVDAAPMSSVKPDIDPNLDVIVLQCLEKDPRERSQSVAQISLDLKRYRRESSRQRMSRITAARPVLQAPGDARQTGALSGITGESAFAGRGKRFWLPWSIAAACTLGFLTLAMIHFREIPAELPSINASVDPPRGYTFDNTIGGHIALSRDGTLLAFVAVDSSGKSSLWVRPLNSSSGRQLAETYGAEFPFWSPDNKFIGFFVPGKLKKVSVSGAPPIVICDAPSGRGGTWNQDGVILFAPSFDLVGIHRVSASGGISTPVTHLDSTRNESNHRWPHFLPDGKHFVYTTQGSVRTPDYAGAIYVASLDSSVNKLLIKVSSNMAYHGGYLLYVRQGSVVAHPFDLTRLELSGDASPIAEKIEFSGDKSRGMFSISNNGMITYQVSGNNTSLLSMVDRDGKKLNDVTDRTIVQGARLSRDGANVVFDSPDPESRFSDIWICDLTRKINTRFTFDQSAEWNPIWSPDGKSIVYSSDEQGSGDLYLKNANGTEADHLLLKDLTPKQPTDWSPDGRYILFQRFVPNSYWDLWAIPAAEEGKPFIVLQSKFEEVAARFSPDGHWIVYQSDESGKQEIYVRPFPSGEGKWQISSYGGELPFWSHDGKVIYYNRPGGGLMSVGVNDAGSAFIVGSAHSLFNIPRSYVFDASRDDKHFLVGTLSGTQSSPPVTLVTNWDKDLRSR